MPIYYDDPEPLILEPNQHNSTPQNRPNSTPPTEPIQIQLNPPYPIHHPPPTHHTHPTYHSEGTMHLCLRLPTTTTTTTQPTLPTPPTAQKVLCTFAFALRPTPPPPPNPPRPPHLPPRRYYAPLSSPPDHHHHHQPPPHHPITHPPTHSGRVRVLSQKLVDRGKNSKLHQILLELVRPRNYCLLSVPCRTETE